MEKWGDYQKKKLFINNAVQALISFKEGHQDLLKLHVNLEEGVSMLDKKEGIFFEAIQNLCKSCFLMALQKRVGGL